MNSPLQKTSLYQEHLKLNAKMVPFSGWEMPVQYTSVKDESLAVRKSVGVFDVSHMGEFFVSGPQAVDFIDYLMTNDFKNAPEGKAVYSPICREDGTVIDDVIGYKIKNDFILVCVNAGNIEKDWNWFISQKKNFNCELKNKSNDYSLLALQGPQAEKILSQLGINAQDLSYYGVAEYSLDNEKVILARTGYTGEDGFEIFTSHELAKRLWANMMEAKVTPCGLAARDLLRLEVCYPLYGHEIHDQVTPLDSSLKWTVKMEKNSFIGKTALQNYKPKFQLVKLALDKGIPRQDYKVENSQQQEIGVVTSGTLSVVLEKGIALAHISQIPTDEKIFINIRNTRYPAQIHKKPFVTGGHK